MHITVDGVELKVRPTHDGRIIFRPVFSSTDARALQAAAKRAEKALQFSELRKWLMEAARMGMERARPLGHAKYLEFKRLLQILEDMS